MDRQPQPISSAEQRVRSDRIAQLAHKYGFIGQVEYRHTDSITAGGAQYVIGETAAQDRLIIYADALGRDADPADFSLDAIVAHECGHQLLVRHNRLSRFLSG